MSASFAISPVDRREQHTRRDGSAPLQAVERSQNPQFVGSSSARWLRFHQRKGPGGGGLRAPLIPGTLPPMN
eukprot:6176322-Prymnesium_polylepis.1